MGWISSDNEHEGWAAAVAPDGRLSASSAGGMCLSNFNEAGFWVLSRYFGISEQVMLKTWTVGVTISGLRDGDDCLAAVAGDVLTHRPYVGSPLAKLNALTARNW